MVAPDLLQLSAEIDGKYGPFALFAEVEQPTNNGFESAKIQSEEKSGDRGHCDGKHNERRRAEPVGAGKVQHNTHTGQNEYQQAQDLDENVDQHTGDGDAAGYSELA